VAKLLGKLKPMRCPLFSGRYADALTACRQAVALYRVVDHRVLGAVLHDSAFMAVNAGEPLAAAGAVGALKAVALPLSPVHRARQRSYPASSAQ
jgi:hypothetical protein